MTSIPAARAATAAVAVYLIAAALAVLFGQPSSVAADVRVNAALAIGVTAVALRWGVALTQPGARSLRVPLLVGLAALLVAALPLLSLSLARTGWIPTQLLFKSLALFALELPLWALALLLWPRESDDAAAPNSARAGFSGRSVLAGLVVGAIFAGLLWVLLVRPVGGIPRPPLARAAAISWTFVAVALGAGLMRGSTRRRRLAFWLTLAGLAAAFIANVVLTSNPSLPPTIVFAGSMLALLFRLGATETLRSPLPQPAHPIAHHAR